MISRRMDKSWVRVVWALALGLGLFPAAAALSTALPAQVVASASVGFPASGNNPHWSTASAQAGVGVALPPLPHLMVMWNLAKFGFDRINRRDGGFVATGLEAWLSPSLRPALSHGPLLLGEADLGRRFGPGLHGFTSVGAGVGWSFGDWVPYMEFRRRLGFHVGRQADQQVLIGVHYVLFG